MSEENIEDKHKLAVSISGKVRKYALERIDDVGQEEALENFYKRLTKKEKKQLLLAFITNTVSMVQSEISHEHENLRYITG